MPRNNFNECTDPFIDLVTDNSPLVISEIPAPVGSQELMLLVKDSPLETTAECRLGRTSMTHFWQKK